MREKKATKTPKLEISQSYSWEFAYMAQCGTQLLAHPWCCLSISFPATTMITLHPTAHALASTLFQPLHC